VTARALRTLVASALLAPALLALSGSARAQGTADQAVTAAQADRTGLRHVPWHDSTFVWQQRVGSQTVGLGADYQSRDPYYDWVFYLRPRYYFWENERTSLSVRAQVGASVELTNSNTTTKQQEFLFDDTLLAFSPEHAFVKDGEYLTDLTLSLPRFVFPTSKSAAASGKIMQIGVRALLVQAAPLREGEDFFPRGYVALRLGYDYQFARWVVPEDPSFWQYRTSVGGVVVANHQLAGAALAEHTGVVHGIVHADIFRDIVALESEFGIDPAYDFEIPNDVRVKLLTGDALPETVSNPQRLTVLTYLDAYLDLMAFNHALKVSIGYQNVTNELNPQSERRNPIWSPDAKLYLRLEFQPDFLLKAAPAAAFGQRRQVAAQARR
jgi:hypothetical protein